MLNDCQCLCGKLRARRFSDVTIQEVNWLRQTLSELAPISTPASSPTSSLRAPTPSLTPSTPEPRTTPSESPPTRTTPLAATSPLHTQPTPFHDTSSPPSAPASLVQSLRPASPSYAAQVSALASIDLLDIPASSADRATPHSAIPVSASVSTDWASRSRKRCRRTINTSLETTITALVRTYPDEEVKQLLDSHGILWQEEHLRFFGHTEDIWPVVSLQGALETSDTRTALIQMFTRMEHVSMMHRILRRLVCVAFTSLHGRKTSQRDVTSLFNTQGLIRTGDESVMKNTVVKMLRWGNVWQDIITSCGNQTGIVFLLGKGYLWERNNSEDRGVALKHLMSRSSFMADVRQYTPLANGLLTRLKGSSGFIQFSVPSSLGAPIGRPAESSFQRRRYISGDATPMSPSVVNRSPDLTYTESASVPLPGQPPISIRDTDTWTVLVNDQQPMWNQGTRHAFQSPAEISDDAALLLSVLIFFDPTGIAISVLEEGCKPQNRWSDGGNAEVKGPESSGLNQSLVSLISDRTRFHQAIDCLYVSSMLRKEQDKRISVPVDLQTRVRQAMKSTIHDFWKHQALSLICHAFPRDMLPRSRHGSVARLCLPQLRLFLYQSKFLTRGENYPSSLLYEIAETLVAASSYLDTTWKLDAIAKAIMALPADAPYHALAAVTYRQSCLLRLLGKLDDSDAALGSDAATLGCSNMALKNISTLRDRMYHILLQVSHAHNMIARDDFQSAIASLQDLREASVGSSALQQVVARRIDLSLGQALRYKGLFREALDILLPIWDTIKDVSELVSFRREVLPELAEVSCELNQAEIFEESLRSEIQDLTQRGLQHQASSRRLMLSYAQCRFRQEDYVSAKAIYLDVLSSCLDKPNLTQRNLLEARIGLAKIHHLQNDLEEALTYWTAALHSLDTYHLGDGRTTMIVHYSSADILRKKGWHKLAQRSIEQAQSLPIGQGGSCWIAGLGTEWLDRMQGSLGLDRANA